MPPKNARRIKGCQVYQRFTSTSVARYKIGVQVFQKLTGVPEVYRSTRGCQGEKGLLGVPEVAMCNRCYHFYQRLTGAPEITSCTIGY